MYVAEWVVAAAWVVGIASGVTLSMLARGYREAHDRGWRSGYADQHDTIEPRPR